MRYCFYHDVATGKYDCPYADVVNNSICCNCNECNYKGNNQKPVVDNLTEEERYIYCKTHLGSLYGKSVYDLLANMSDEAFPF